MLVSSFYTFWKYNLVKQISPDKLTNVLTSHAIDCPGLVFPGGGMKGLCLCLGLFWKQIYKYGWKSSKVQWLLRFGHGLLGYNKA